MENTKKALDALKSGLRNIGRGLTVTTKSQRRACTDKDYFKRPNLVNKAHAYQMNEMHDKWEKEQFPSRVTKKEADHDSITQIKLNYGCQRNFARIMQAERRVK